MTLKEKETYSQINECVALIYQQRTILIIYVIIDILAEPTPFVKMQHVFSLFFSQNQRIFSFFYTLLSYLFRCYSMVQLTKGVFLYENKIYFISMSNWFNNFSLL